MCLEKNNFLNHVLAISRLRRAFSLFPFLKPRCACKSEEGCLSVSMCVMHRCLFGPSLCFLNALMLHMQAKVPYLVFPPDCKGSSSFQYKQSALQLHLLRAGL